MRSRARADRDTDAARELRAHLDEEAEELSELGLSSEQAEAAARRRFGNSTLIQEEMYEVWNARTWEHLLQDMRYAVRVLRKSPGFSVVALLSLALGIGANTAIFTFVNAAFLKPLPYPDADRMVALQQRDLKSRALTMVKPRSFVPWQERSSSFESLAIAQPVPLNTEGADGYEQVPRLWMSRNLFQVFGVRPFLGSGFRENGKGAIELRQGEVGELVLSYEYWQRRFGADRSIIGRSIAAGAGSAVVVGVMPAGFRIANLKVDAYSPIRMDRTNPDSIGSRSFLSFGRLRPGVTLEAAQAEMDALATHIGEGDATERNYGVVLMGLRDYLVGEHRSVLFILTAVVGLVLLITCGNLASLLLTRGVGRKSELAVRAAVGAGRGRIIQQLVVESLVLSLAGGLLGLGLGWLGSRSLTLLSEQAVNFGQLSDATLDVRVAVFTLAISLLTALIFGLFPAWQASRVDLQSSIKSQSKGATGASGQNRVRSLVVMAEIGLSVVLLAGAGLLLRTLLNLADVKFGFRPEQVVTMRTLVLGDPNTRAALVESILQRVESVPGVTSVGTIQFLPLGGMTNRGPFRFVGRPVPSDASAMESDVSTVSRGYFAAIGMDLLRGRPFGRQDVMGSARVALVNQSFVNRYSPGEDPLGRVIMGDWADPKPTEIIGVVNDVRHNGLRSEPRPTVFLSQSQVPGYFTNLVVRANANPSAIASAVRREVRNVDPKQPFTDIRPMADYVAKEMARPRLYASFVGMFAILAMFLAITGIYGLLAYEVSQRRHEIGLRMALGAQPGHVLWTTMGRGFRLVVYGIVLGTAIAYAGSRFLVQYLFGVPPADPYTYLGVAALFVLVAMVATWVPARRSARIDPAIALRCD